LGAEEFKHRADNPGTVLMAEQPDSDGLVHEIAGVSISADGVALQLPDGTTHDIEFSANLVTRKVVASDVINSHTNGTCGDTGYYCGVVMLSAGSTSASPCHINIHDPIHPPLRYRHRLVDDI
jgi:hypothetical protein